MIWPPGVLQPGEAKRAQVAVLWTDRPGTAPDIVGELYCTDRRLVLSVPYLPQAAIVVLWPVLGLAGYAVAGMFGVLAGFGVLAALLGLLPRRVVQELPLGAVHGWTLVPVQGWRRMTERDVVEVAATVAGAAVLWRLARSGRGEMGAQPIVEALRAAGPSAA